MVRLGDAGIRLLATALLTLVGGCAQALDNPDAPDPVAAFEAREAPYRRAVEAEASTTEAYRMAYGAYVAFLDDELNDAYRALIDELEGERAEDLRTSQRAWLAYRDAEFRFIEGNWRSERFGSSAVISRGDYRVRIIRSRVMTLLQYLRNY